MDRITGSISAVGSVTGTLSAQAGLTGALTVPMVAEAEYYEGDYDVTPIAFQSIVLGTRHKMMHNDVTVHEIPYYEVTNPAGGYTVNIGG